MKALTSPRIGIALLLGVAAVLAGGVVSSAASRQEATPRSDLLLVTSSLGANSAVLFVVDPTTQRMAAYEAIPGDGGGVRLIGARKIQHDLLLSRYRDLSELTLEQLRDRYQSESGEVAEDR